MKKLLVVIAAFLMFVGQISAAPVDVDVAKNLGVKYLRTNVLSAKDMTDVELVYTLRGADDTPYLYVFNYA